MRWTAGSRSGNIEDRRGQGFGGFGARGLGIGGTVVLLVLSLVFGKDFFSLLGASSSDEGVQPGTVPVQSTPEEERLVDFISVVLDSTQSTWAKSLAQEGAAYRPAKLVLFRDATESGCGFAQSATGPFYCPADEKVYVDLGFYDELRSRFGAPGDFAQAYVLAHEIGHHVQHLLGIDTRGDRRANATGGSEFSVRLELQADCFAGIWGHRAAQQGMLEPGDVEEGLGAASAVGDDRMQRMGGATVSPDAFTHGSSAQRMTWFKRGLTTGRISDCDTFK